VTGTPYLDFPDESSPAGHPRCTLVRSSLRAIAYDVFAPTHACVYRYADPLGALNIAVMADGDELGCLAPIGDTVPDTITDRAVVVTARRGLSGEVVRSYREGRDPPIIRALGQRLGAWFRGNLKTLEATDPELPVEDRAADVWAPRVAIADLSGGDWPARARKAALVFTREADADAVEESLSVRLLADLRTVFTDPVMSSTRLVELLRRFPKPFGIRSISSRGTGPGDSRARRSSPESTSARAAA
jgi:Protein of unknown function (DUF3631)